jgi:1-acyl-sn-glycerol-3-phosphate acyltransferase
VPVALDSGRYWQGFTKRPGTITLEFVEAIPPGLKRDAFMPLLQERIEIATGSLLKLPG